MKNSRAWVSVLRPAAQLSGSQGCGRGGEQQQQISSTSRAAGRGEHCSLTSQRGSPKSLRRRPGEGASTNRSSSSSGSSSSSCSCCCCRAFHRGSLPQKPASTAQKGQIQEKKQGSKGQDDAAEHWRSSSCCSCSLFIAESVWRSRGGPPPTLVC
ncbi:hypothetical protein, conserved, partial [Eimeria tenella]